MFMLFVGKGKKGKKGRGGGGGDDSDSEHTIYDEEGNVLPSKEAVKKYKAMKAGKRNENSDSEYR